MVAVRPLVLPEPFSGDGSWSQWESHFEDVAVVNSWEEEAKLLWLRVRLTGRARTAYQRFSEETKTSYECSMKGLKKRFEPDSKKELYLAELRARCKQRNEGWPEFAKDIRLLADSAYPNLPDDAREQISLTLFLGQITNPHIAFSVKQSRPKNLDEAVTATLEMESYATPSMSKVRQNVGTAPVNQLSSADETTPPAVEGGPTEQISMASVGQDGTRLVSLMESIVNRMDKLETRLDRERGNSGRPARRVQGTNQEPRSPVICHRCGREGHYARGCASRRQQQQQQGN